MRWRRVHDIAPARVERDATLPVTSVSRARAAAKRFFSGILAAGIFSASLGASAQDINSISPRNNTYRDGVGMAQKVKEKPVDAQKLEKHVEKVFDGVEKNLRKQNLWRPETERIVGLLKEYVINLNKKGTTPLEQSAIHNKNRSLHMDISRLVRDLGMEREVEAHMEGICAATKCTSDTRTFDPKIHKVAESLAGALEEYEKLGGVEKVFDSQARVMHSQITSLIALSIAVQEQIPREQAEVVPSRVVAVDAEKQERKYGQTFKHFIELAINLDSVAKNPQRLEAYISAYNKMPSEEQEGFKKFLEENLGALMPTLARIREGKGAGADEKEINELMGQASGEVTRNELNALLIEMNLGFNIELPQESEAGKGVGLSLTMEKMMRMLVRYSGASSGSDMFNMEGMLKGIEEVRAALNNYLELSSSPYMGTWSPAIQEAFLATLQAGDSKLSEVKSKHRGTAAQGVRLAMRMRQNMEISDLMVASMFGYDWEQVFQLRTGAGLNTKPVFTKTQIAGMKAEASDTVRLAKMHSYLLSSGGFSSARNSFLEKTEGISAEEIEDAMIGEVGEAPTPEQEMAASEREAGRSLLNRMDLLTQYVFLTHTWNVLENTTLQDYVKLSSEPDGRVEVADMINDPLAKPHGIRKVIGVVSKYLEHVGRGGHLGMMLNGVPLAMNYVNSYNEVVDVLGVMYNTSNNITNTNAYAEMGAGRVLWYYTMIQVPKNFMEANEDNYNQLIDMMLRNPLASGYIGEHMQKNMLEVQTTREMLRRFLNVYSLRSGAVRPGEIPIYAAPQDFSLADALDRRSYELGRLARTMLGSSPVGGWENYGVGEGEPGTGALAAQEGIRDRISQMIASSGDEMLSSWWKKERSMHDVFLDFFTPSKVKLVPNKEYAVVPMIPMSLNKLTQLLSMVEGVPRYISPNAFERGRAGAGGRGAFHGVTETSGGERTGGEESTRAYYGQGGIYAFGPETSAGAAGGYSGAEREITAPVEELEGPPEPGEGQIGHYLDSTKRGYWAAMSRDVSTDGWPIIREPLSTSMYATGAHARQERTDMETGETRMVMDDRVHAALEHYAREYNTDGVTILRWERRIDENTESEYDSLRAYTWGKIKGNWYRIGYMDVSSKDEQGNTVMSAGMKRLFTALNIDNYAEFRQLSGKEWRREGDIDITEASGEESWTLYGALLGVNFTNLFTGGEPPGKWNLVGAGIYNRGGKPRPERPSLTGQPVPSSATYDQDIVNVKVKEYAAGMSMLFREISWTESAVGFATAIGRTALEGEEKLESGRGGAGVMGRVVVNKAEDRMAEFGAGVGENWGEDTVGFTLAWQDRQILFDKQYNIAIADIVPTLYYGGLVGTMHKGEDLRWFLVGDGYYLAGRAAEKAGIRGYAGELGVLETEDLRIQQSALFQMLQVRWNLGKVISRLNEVENKLNEYRNMPPAENVGQNIPDMGPLQQEITYAEAIQQLEREQNILRRMQTALGLIEAQWFFGTASVVHRFMDDKARLGVEGIFGGPDEWGALMNSFIEVDDKFAAAFNIQGSETHPKGSMGGKIVVPFSGMVLASTLGMYYREDLKGPNANFGLSYDPIREYGIGAIIGGMARTGTLAAGGEGAQPVRTERNVLEGMVLGWMPWWEGSRAQAYFVYAKEVGTNTYSRQERLDIDRFGAGARLLWVGETGIAYNVEAEWFRKNLGASLARGLSPHYEQKTDQFSAGFRIRGTENVEGRLQAVATRLEALRNDAMRAGESSKYTRWEYAFFADLFITF